MTGRAESFIKLDGISARELAPGILHSVRVPGGTTLCIGKHNNTLFAVPDSCPHAEFPLSEGALYANGEIECCWHGARFDCLTGTVLRGPAEQSLQMYEIEERDGSLWVRSSGGIK